MFNLVPSNLYSMPFSSSKHLEMKQIGNFMPTKCFYRHPIHVLGMDSVIPEKAAQHFAKGPALPIAPLKHGIVQKVWNLLQLFKASATTIQNGSFIVGIHPNLAKVIRIHVFGMLIHLLRRSWNLPIERASYRNSAGSLIWNGLI